MKRRYIVEVGGRTQPIRGGIVTQLLSILFWLLVLACVGHGLWLIGRALLRAIFRDRFDAPLDAGPLDRAWIDERRVTIHYLDKLRDEGKLDPETHRSVVRQITLPPALPPALPSARPTPVATPTPAPVPRPVPEKLWPPPHTPFRADEPAITMDEMEPTPEPAPKPKRGTAEWLLAFMQERNIRWGELIGAALIVVSSVALVMSLWGRIAANPIGKLFLFVGVNTAIFAVGWLTHSRLRLPLTGRALLIVATLLVPLNFLAITAMGAGETNPWWPLAQGMAALFFVVAVGLAGRVVCAPFPWALAVGVVGAGASALLAERTVDAGNHLSLQGFAILPLFAHLLAMTLPLGMASRWSSAGRLKSHALFALLGCSTFAAATAMALAVHLYGPTRSALLWLSPLLVALANPALSAGMEVSRRVGRRRLATLRTAALSVSVAGAALLVGLLMMAWPVPYLMTVVSAASAASMLVFAFGSRIPQAHLAAIAFAVVAFLLACSEDALSMRMVRVATIASAASGAALCWLVLGIGGVAAICARFGRREDAKWLGIGAGGVAGLSLMLVTWFGFGRVADGGAVWVYLFYAVGALVAAFLLPSRGTIPAWVGSGLLATAVAQWVVFQDAETFSAIERLGKTTRWQVALLIHSTLAVLLVVVTSALGRGRVRRAVCQSALVTSGVAAVLVVYATSLDSGGGLAIRTLWVGAIWLIAALSFSWPYAFTVFQATTCWAGMLGITALSDRIDLLDVAPGILYRWPMQGGAIAFVAACWIALRTFVPTRLATPDGATDRLFFSNPWTRVCEVCVVALPLLYLAWAVGWGLAWEGVVREFYLRHGHDHPLSGYIDPQGMLWWPLWWLWLTTAAGGLLLCVARREGWRWVFPAVSAWALCLLLAILSDDARATASALRWWLSGLWLVTALWMMRRDVPWLRIGMAVGTVIPVIGLSLYSLIRAWNGQEFSHATADSIFGRMDIKVSFCVPLAMLWIGMAALALRWRLVSSAWGAAVTLNLLATWLFIEWALKMPVLYGVDLWFLNTAVLAAPAGLCALWTGSRPALRTYYAPSVCIAGIATTLLDSALLLADVFDPPQGVRSWVLAVSVLASIFGSLCCLSDRALRWPTHMLYVLGLAAMGTVIHIVRLEERWTLYGLLVGGAAYTLIVPVTIRLWQPRRWAMALLSRESALSRGVGHVVLQFWRRRSRTVLDNYNVALSWIVGFGVLLLVLTWKAPEANTGLMQRLILAASLLLTRAGAVVAGRLRSALWLGTTAAVAFAWAWAEPGGTFGNPLHRAVFAMVALGAMSILYGWALVKLPWAREGMVRAAWQAMPAHVGLTGVALLVTCLFELLAYEDVGGTSLTWPVNALVGATILALAVTAILWAVVPGRDPLNLSERGRMGYVFAAEALLGLLFAHIRLTMPELFSGWIMPYWPLIVMAIAFVGVGLGEFFKRRQSLVLAVPLESTGALLPLLPVLGFWFASGVHYSAQLVLVGLLYATLSVTRRSFGFGLLAALAGNGGLWYFLEGREGWGFFDHPQLWLIPASLCVLLGAQLNKRNLTAAQLAAIRYPALLCVYVSSTAEIFLAGVAATPWLPLLLCALSVVGVLCGMAMRVRSILFMGGAFFGMSLVTILAHAAKRYDAAWLWWAGGISMGLAILMLFAYFERQRSKVMGLVEKLRSWEA